MRYEILELSNGYLVSFPLNDNKLFCKMVYSIDEAFDLIRDNANKEAA